MLTLIESYKAGLLNRKFWLQNIIAGVIVGIVALPLSIAFAIATGAKPEQGLYTAIVAGLIVSILVAVAYKLPDPPVHLLLF